jgi:hypothetical protein
MIIFQSVLTTFIAKVILEAAGAVAIIGLSFKFNHHKQI